VLVGSLACGSGGAPAPGGDGGGNCGGASAGTGGEGGGPELVINELMSQNDGAWIDGRGETDDWVELLNRSSQTLELANYALADGSAAAMRLPQRSLPPGECVLLWVDSDPSQGPLHLPFKLASGGERLVLTDVSGTEIDSADVPALDVNHVYARFPSGDGPLGVCRYATPGRDNGVSCAPAPPPSFTDDVEFAPYVFPEVFPPAPVGLTLSELALRPAEGEGAFIELANTGGTPLGLDTVQLRVSPHGPSLPWPDRATGGELGLPAGHILEPGEILTVPVVSSALTLLAGDPAFEGVVTAFDRASGSVLDRVDFMRWPVGSALARNPDAPGSFRFCTNTTPGAANDCVALPSRDVGDRLRHLRTPGDFAALAQGGDAVGIQSTKFVVDLAVPGLVHLIGARRWPLHYTFVREQVERKPALDRCDPVQDAEFYAGWVEFSNNEYYGSQRRFHLGTLSHHASVNLDAIEFTYADVITGEQMRDAYFTLAPHLDHARTWVLHPQDAEQVTKLRAIEGRAPLVGMNAPYEGMTYQPLTEGVAYGTLVFVPSEELLSASLGPRVIAITDDVPNDVPLVAGLITEAFQTPLAHVNVLSQNRGTPNAALVNARSELGGYLEQLVKLEVTPGGLEVSLADPAEAEAFWQSRLPQGEPVTPRMDTSVRGVQDLTLHGFGSLPMIGAKAAQMAELLKLAGSQPSCLSAARFVAPVAPFAIPLVHYREHFTASGAEQLLAELEAQAGFRTEPSLRAEGLAQVRQRILDQPVEPSLLAEVEAAVLTRFGQERVRFRSSSNTEDLPNFNGAGLYTSISAELGDPERPVADALRTVWASLWNARAYDERAYAGIQRDTLGMGVLCHPASLGEGANGVGVSRNILEPIRGDQYYINAQLGEASVTNPAPAVSTEQLVYQWYRSPSVLYQSQSSLLGAYAPARSTVLDVGDVVDVACALQAVSNHFRPLLDPAQDNAWFAMEIEFKFMGPARQLLVKQARPHSFGRREIIADCREF